jgi:hypothetical protein
MLPKNYHDISESDQVAHWVGYIYRGMRWSGEDGCDEISILDRKELEMWKRLDPTIERLMPRVLDGLAEMWHQPKDAFFKRVNEQMGTQFSSPPNEQFTLRQAEIFKSPTVDTTSPESVKKRWWRIWS